MHPLTDATATGLLNSLKNQHAPVRRRAVKTLGDQKLDAQLAIRQLRKSLGDADAAVRVLAVKALANVGAQAVPTLVAALASPDVRVRREAVWGLGRIGSAAAAAVAPLAAALRDPDVRVSQGAARSLGLIGPAAAGAVPNLMALLSESNYVLCRLAAWALGQIGAAAVPALAEGLRGPDIYVRCDAAWALAQIGPPARAAVPALLAVLRSGHAECLHRSDEPEKSEPELNETTPVLIPARKGTMDAFCLLTIKALGSIAREARAAVPDLIELLHTGNGTAQILAARALRQIDNTAADAFGVL